MAVVHVKEIIGRGGSQDNKSRKRYTRVFQVLTDDPTDGTRRVREADGLPVYGDTWEQVNAVGTVTDTDESAVVVEKRATQTDENNPQNWMVWVEYAGVDDPTFEPPRVQFSTLKYQEVSQRDVTGQKYVNSAGDAFLNGFVRDRTRRVLVIEQNVLTYDPITEDEYIDTLNQVEFLVGRFPPGFPPRTCKLSDISAEVVFYEGYPVDVAVHYYRKRCVIEIDYRGWDDYPLDQGYRKLVSAGGTLTPVREIDVAGGTNPHQLLLDGKGFKLGEDHEPVYLGPFYKYVTKDWTLLALEF